MSVMLIADSGSTKTDWCLIQSGRKKYLQTQGINPYFMQAHEIKSILEHELKINPKKIQPDEIHFYGAGINSDDKQKVIAGSLRDHFGTKKIQSYSDMLAAARATCLHEKGIACILGTGSNSCYFDGKQIKFKTPSLGFILGDEGGATSIGKKLLQYYLHDIMEADLKAAFENQFPNELNHVLEDLYRKPFPNRFMAQFARFIFEHRNHFMIENIAEDCLNDFFINHLLRYPKIHQLPVHFSGSVAFHLQDILEALCEQYEIQLGTVIQKPIKGLAAFHAGAKG